MSRAYQFLATSDHWIARFARATRRGLHRFDLPTPQFVNVVARWIFVCLRSAWYFILRFFVCQPIVKSYFRTYGKRCRTGVHLPWVSGKGSLIAGDDVLIDGAFIVSFGARFSPDPTLRIGDRTGIGHNCGFTVGKEIVIGRECRIASDVWMFDSPGHPADPELRRAGRPPDDSDVKPIRIGDNVWIGRRSIICPGVTIGENSIVAVGSVVVGDVPSNTVVAGNPARRFASVGPAGA